MSKTRSGEMTSAQIAKMGVIDTSDDFRLSDGQCFQIKNDGVESVVLSVQLAGMDDGDFIETRFDSGWNPEIVKVVRSNAQRFTNLKWGY